MDNEIDVIMKLSYRIDRLGTVQDMLCFSTNSAKADKKIGKINRLAEEAIAILDEELVDLVRKHKSKKSRKNND